MSDHDALFAALADVPPERALDELVDRLRAADEPDRLFDALLLKAKADLGVAAVRPATFDGVPEEQAEAFEQAYLHAAREVIGRHADADRLDRAFDYARTIGEPALLRPYLDKVDVQSFVGPDADEERLELLTAVALQEGVHPELGVRLMLAGRGTCNTVTLVDTLWARFKPAERAAVAAVLANHLHDELRANVAAEIVAHPSGGEAPEDGGSLRPLLAGRPWLMADCGYHTDVSHLQAVVRNGRDLPPEHPSFEKVVELAEYGAKLDATLQYPGRSPFTEFYPAHLRYLAALTGRGREEAFRYFEGRMTAADDHDRPLAAIELVALLRRCGETDRAVELAAKELRDREDGTFSFAELCREVGRLEALADAAKAADDPVRYAAALALSGNKVEQRDGRSRNRRVTHLPRNAAAWDRLARGGSGFARVATDEEIADPRRRTRRPRLAADGTGGETGALPRRRRGLAERAVRGARLPGDGGRSVGGDAGPRPPRGGPPGIRFVRHPRAGGHGRPAGPAGGAVRSRAPTGQRLLRAGPVGGLRRRGPSAAAGRAVHRAAQTAGEFAMLRPAAGRRLPARGGIHARRRP